MQPSERASPADCYQIGDLLVDTAEQSVRRDGVELPLPRLSYELLLALIRAHPRMLSNDELATSVWTPAIVNPETVSQRVKLLRYALGDDDVQNPRYIARVRGRGYRLTVPVTLHASVPNQVSPAQESAEPPEPEAPATRRTWRPLILTSAAATALITIGFAVWHWQTSRESVSAPPPSHAFSAPAVKASAKVPRSIAVLPFLDLSEKRDETFFADGMTEEITSLLSQAADLRVSARTSAFYFKDHSMPVGEIGNALGVANVLEGSVRKSGDLLRITVQLIRTDTGYHIWSASYDRRADDLFGTQTEIAQSVLSHLQASLDLGARRRDPLSSNPKARNLYLEAMMELPPATPAGLHKALALLQDAVAEDPNFALAWAVLASARFDRAGVEDAPPSEIRPIARQAIDRALAIDPSLPDAHSINARLLEGDWKIREAMVEAHRALDADPNHWSALLALGWLEALCRHHEEAIRLGNESIERNPLQAFTYATQAQILYFGGHNQEAIDALRAALVRNPRAASYHIAIARIQLVAGDPRAALSSLDEAKDDVARAILRPVMLDALGQHAEAEREQAEAERKYGAFAPAGASLAIFYAGRGDADRAMPLLERSYRYHDLSLPFLKEDPLFTKLRPDPRFQAFIRRFDIPE